MEKKFSVKPLVNKRTKQVTIVVPKKQIKVNWKNKIPKKFDVKIKWR